MATSGHAHEQTAGRFPMRKQGTPACSGVPAEDPARYVSSRPEEQKPQLFGHRFRVVGPRSSATDCWGQRTGGEAHRRVISVVPLMTDPGSVAWLTLGRRLPTLLGLLADRPGAQSSQEPKRPFGRRGTRVAVPFVLESAGPARSNGSARRQAGVVCMLSCRGREVLVVAWRGRPMVAEMTSAGRLGG
jgi:hypothetical protein